ncbi:MAG: glycosyltransferase family 2 protein [Candidatus Limimorpha sp.]
MNISLITVTYNSAATLRDTIQSVINQTFKDIEYILVDGGSNDGTVDIIKEFEPLFQGKMRWVSERDKGIYDAMNKGIAMATGDVVGILNSDDFFASDDILHTVSDTFERDNQLDGVYADVIYVDKNNITKTLRRFSGKIFTRKRLCYGFMPPHPSFFIKKDCYRKSGPYSLKYPICADYDMFVKMFWELNINTEYIPKVFVTMRSGGASGEGLKVHRKIMRERIACVREHNLPSNALKQSIRYFEKLASLLKK